MARSNYSHSPLFVQSELAYYLDQVGIIFQLKALSKKEQSLNAELSKQMNVHFLKPTSQIAEERCEAAFYGVCELVDGYQKVGTTTALHQLMTLDNVDFILPPPPNPK